jgi:hypothetical protein
MKRPGFKTHRVALFSYGFKVFAISKAAISKARVAVSLLALFKLLNLKSVAARVRWGFK